MMPKYSKNFRLGPLNGNILLEASYQKIIQNYLKLRFIMVDSKRK